jgi:hypothetical protein
VLEKSADVGEMLATRLANEQYSSVTISQVVDVAAVAIVDIVAEMIGDVNVVPANPRF